MSVSALLVALALPALAGAPRGGLAAFEPVPEPPGPAARVEPVPEPPELPEPPGSIDPAGAIRWQAPVACPAAPEVRRGIERRLGRTLAERDAEVDARVEPTGSDGGFRLVLRTTAAGVVDERTLEAVDCRVLADATALVVALAIDPVAVAEAMIATAGDDPLEVPPAEPPAPTPVRRGQSQPARPDRSDASGAGLARSRRPGGLLRAGAGVGLGALPGVTGVPSLAAGLRWRRARLELEGAYWIPRVSEPIDGGRVVVQLGTATARGCGQLGRDRLEAPLCGGLQVGGMRGEGRGAPEARAAQGPWVALEAGMGLSWRLGRRWALAGGFTAAIPVYAPAFELVDDPPPRLFEPSAVAGRVWLGVELRLGAP